MASSSHTEKWWVVEKDGKYLSSDLYYFRSTKTHTEKPTWTNDLAKATYMSKGWYVRHYGKKFGIARKIIVQVTKDYHLV